MAKKSVILKPNTATVPFGALTLTVADMLALKPVNDSKSGGILTRGAGSVVVMDDRTEIAVEDTDGAFRTYTVSINISRQAKDETEKTTAEKNAAARQATKEARELADQAEREKAIQTAVSMTRDATVAGFRAAPAAPSAADALKQAVEGAQLLSQLSGVLGNLTTAAPAGK